MSPVANILDMEALLGPVSEESPGGEDLRYEPIYDEIKALRNPGELVEPDTEDWRKIQSLTSEAISKESKDLQLAVWLLEAVTHLDGFAGTASGLELVRKLLEEYWETLYPEIDDEDEEPLSFRTGIIEWICGRLLGILQGLPLTTETGYSVLHYHVTQKSGDEKEALIADGWPSSEQFEEAMDATPLAELESNREEIEACLQELSALEKVTDKRFVQKREGSERTERLVSFSDLKEGIEECLWLVERAAKKKRPKPEPKTETPPQQAVPEAEEASAAEQSEGADASAAATAIPAPEAAPASASAPTARQVDLGHPPASAREAYEQVFGLVEYLRKENKYHPSPFVLNRAVSVGNVLYYDELVQAQPIPAPPQALRQRIEKLAQSEKWEELLAECEAALLEKENWFWLDLHFYAVQAMSHLESYYNRPILAVKGTLRLLLDGHPDLLDAELADSSQAAAPQTRSWIEKEVLPGAGAASPASAAAQGVAASSENGEDWAREVEEARALLRSKKVQQGLQLLQERIASSKSGRSRFIRKLQLSELCLEANLENLAFPILDELARTIDDFRLEQWEDKELVARSWAALVDCCRRLSRSNPSVSERADEIFSRLCRLDVTRALNIG